MSGIIWPAPVRREGFWNFCLNLEPKPLSRRRRLVDFMQTDEHAPDIDSWRDLYRYACHKLGFDVMLVRQLWQDFRATKPDDVS
jgi:hypothetical protein